MSPTPKKKICSRCKKTKSVSEFCTRSDSKDSLGYWCRNCRTKHQRNERKKEGYKQAIKKYQQSEKGKATYKKATKKYWRTEKAKLGRYKRNLKDNYGITLKQYDEMLDKQKGVCAICKKSETIKDKYGGIKRLAVDHNHKTGRIRSLLCGRCNFLVGHVENNVDLTKRILKYI